MISWFRKIEQNGYEDELDDAILYYDEEYENATKDLEIKGSVTNMLSRMPGLIQYRFSQLQDLCAICEYMEVEKNKIISTKFKGYLEGYSKKVISSRDADKFASADPDVENISKKYIAVCLSRDQFMGIYEGLKTKHFQLTNIVKLKSVGIDDFSIDF